MLQKILKKLLIYWLKIIVKGKQKRKHVFLNNFSEALGYIEQNKREIENKNFLEINENENNKGEVNI